MRDQVYTLLVRAQRYYDLALSLVTHPRAADRDAAARALRAGNNMRRAARQLIAANDGAFALATILPSTRPIGSVDQTSLGLRGQVGRAQLKMRNPRVPMSKALRTTRPYLGEDDAERYEAILWSGAKGVKWAHLQSSPWPRPRKGE